MSNDFYGATTCVELLNEDFDDAVMPGTYTPACVPRTVIDPATNKVQYKGGVCTAVPVDSWKEKQKATSTPYAFAPPRMRASLRQPPLQ